MGVVSRHNGGVLMAVWALALVGMAGRAMAQATISQMQGAVEVRAGGTSQWTPAAQGQSLPAGSLIRTEQGTAVLSLPDGTAVAVWTGTTLDLRQMEFKADTKALNLTAIVWQGRLQFNLTTSPNAESSYVVKTPNAQVALVRAEGNVWYAKEAGTRVAIAKGQATVSAAGKSVTLAAGTATQVAPGSAPQAPQATSPTAAPSVAPPVQSPPTPPSAVTPTPPASLSEAAKKKQLIKDRLMGVRSIMVEEILSPEEMDSQIEQLQKAVNKDPGDIVSHARLAALYTQRQRPASKDRPFSDVEAAVIHYQIVAKAEEGSAESHLHLGEAYARSGEADKAIAEFKTALRIEPKSAHAHLWLALVYDALNRWEEAEQEHKIAIDLERDDPLLHAVYARFLAYRGRLQEAIEELRQALKLIEGTPFTVLKLEYEWGLARLYLANKQIDEALALLRSIAERVPQAAEVHVFLGAALLRKGQKQEAQGEFDKASRLAPNNPFLHFELAQMYELEGDKKKAADELEILLNTLPPGFVAPPGFPSLADIRDHMRVLRGLEPLQKDKGDASKAT